MVGTYGGMSMVSVMMVSTVLLSLLLLEVYFHPIIYGQIVSNLLTLIITVALMLLFIVRIKNAGQ
jgi:hypothetical protein